MNGHDAKVLRSAALPTLVVGAAAVAIGAAVSGSKGALGAVLGVVVVAFFFSITLFVVGRASPATMLNVALLTYVVKILVLLVLIGVLKDSTWFDGQVFGLTVVACTLAWTGGEVWAYSKMRILYVDPENYPSEGSPQPGSDPAQHPSS